MENPEPAQDLGPLWWVTHDVGVLVYNDLEGSRVTGLLKPDAVVREIVKQTFSDHYLHYRLRTGNGPQEGWVARKYLTSEASLRTIVQLRREADTVSCYSLSGNELVRCPIGTTLSEIRAHVAQVRQCTPRVVKLVDDYGRTLIDPVGPGDHLLFTRGWLGHRRNFEGEVGISFIPNVQIVVTAAGRHCGGRLYETVPVTLWSTAMRAPLASVRVGPGSPTEAQFALEVLDAPITLEPGQEYRLSQTCTKDMMDSWFDRIAEEYEPDVCHQAVTFIGGVYSRGHGSFPVDEDGAFRRAGMLNFRFRTAVENAEPY